MREGQRENNIILKAIAMNSPQFRHESAALSLTREKRKEKERRTKKQKLNTETQTDE